MAHLISSQLHCLPQHLVLEFGLYSSGNRNVGVLVKLKAIWHDNALAGRGHARIVIFANTRACTGKMGVYLSKHGMPNIVVMGHGIKGQSNKQGRDGQCVYSSNKHLAEFLKPMLPNEPDDLLLGASCQ